MPNGRTSMKTYTKTVNGDCSNKIYFIDQDQIDCLLARGVMDLGHFSHEEASSVFHLLKFLFRNANKPFTPFYDDGHSLNNQVRKGWILQVGLLPPRFTVNLMIASFCEMIENRTKEICGDVYQVFKELISDIANVEDRKSWLKKMERAAVAYDKLPEHMRKDFLVNSGIECEEASQLLHQVETYVKKCNED